MAGFGNADEFPFTNAWLLNEHPLLTSLSLPKVKGVTVNKVSDSLLQKNQLVELLNPAVESMEGAAFHYVCLHEKIPFLQMRSISNKVGDRNKANWNFKDAIINLDCELNKLISAVTTATAK
jgi:futalosine hydrolase